MSERIIYKRARAFDDAVDDDWNVTGPMRAASESTTNSIDRRIKRLDLKNATSEPKNFSRPLSQYSARQSQVYHELIGAIAQTVEENIIRPGDREVLTDLRRQEAAAHPRASSTSISIYKTTTPNTRYGSSGPLGWMQQPTAAGAADKLKLADTWSRQSAAAPQHTHSKVDTLILDVRFACNCGVTSELPDNVKNTVLFPYMTLPLDEKTMLQRMSQHNTFVLFANNLSRGETVQTVEQILKTAPTIPLFAVRFCHDDKIQIVFHIDLDMLYFGVLVFKLSVENARALRVKILEELSAESESAAKKAAEPLSTISVMLKDTDVREEMDRLARLNDGYFKDYTETALSANGTGVDRLLACSCPLAVFAPEKSPALLETRVVFQYFHFSVCQCAIDDEDLVTYKLAYAKHEPRATSGGGSGGEAPNPRK